MRAALSLLLLVGAACADEPRAASWRFVFDDPAVALATEAVEASVLDGGCEAGSAVYAEVVTRDSEVEAPGRLGSGRYGLRGRALDADCRVRASGCLDVDFPVESGREIEVLLVSATLGAGCTLDACEGGVCGRSEADVLFAAPAEGITVDGLLDEPAWDLAVPLTFADEDGDDDQSENEATVRALFSADHLWIGYEVTDGDLQAPDWPSVWEVDGPELYLDTLYDRTDRMEPDDYHFMVSIAGDVEILQGTTSNERRQLDVTERMSLERAFVDREDGWTGELRIEWGDLEVVLSGRRAMGLLVANNDRDGDPPTFYDQFDWQSTANWDRPVEWGALVLEDPALAGE